METTQTTYQNVGHKFSRELYLKARKKTIELAHRIHAQVQPGMVEKQIHEIYKTELARCGAEKSWHPPKLRINKNTLCNFRDISDQEITLQENDVFFIDIGPVFHGHEGDYGETFSFGNDPEHIQIADAVKVIFHDVEKYWMQNRPTGKELYQYAATASEKYGYALNLKMAGHRLSDWPHAIFFKGQLSDLNEVPKPDLWVLEIHIRHPERNFGAFYEDIMSER